MYKFMHFGVPTTEKKEGEIYLQAIKVYVSRPDNPFSIEFVRFADDCTFPEIVKTHSHVAFEVDDLAKALEGQEVIIPPTKSKEPFGMTVAFILCEGVPIELTEFDK